jgi:gas vesicle protein
MRKQIKSLDKDIELSINELNLWRNFRDEGSHSLDTQIRLLRQELADMKENYEIISTHIKTNIEQAVEQIKRKTNDIIEKKNKSAAEVNS